MDFIKKHYATAIYLLGGLLALIIVIKIGQLSSADSKEVEDALHDSTAALGVAFVKPLVFISGLLTIGFSIYKISKDKAMLIRFGIGIALLGLIFLISYGAATNDINSISSSVPFTSGELQFVGGLVKTLYVLIIVGFSVLVIGEIKKVITND